MSYQDAVSAIQEICGRVVASVPKSPTWTEVASIISSLILAGVAVWGVNTWRRQLKGTSEYQIAHKVLRAVFALRDSITSAREIVIYSEEKIGREPIAGETELEAEVMDTVHVYHNRLKPVLERQSDLHLAELEALALWGDEASVALEPLFKAFRELHLTYRTFFQMDYLRAKEGKKSGQRRDDVREMHRILFRRPSDDSYAKGVDDAVKRAEAFYRPKLK